MNERYPCPCCGHVVFEEPPGSYNICDVCFWEDDAIQLRWPDYAGGANKPSLIESQANFRQHGAMEPRFVDNVRPPADDEPLDPGWRPIDLRFDRFERGGFGGWPSDLTVLYWWRPTFWRADRTTS